MLRNSSIPGTTDLANVTPAVPKRIVKLPAYLQSPFLQHFGSSSKANQDDSEIKRLEAVYPLDDKIGELPDMDACSEFLNWLDTGLIMNKKK